ncbi:MAG: N(G),N(G)-dimethylarginine dimethylaminohydrolase [Candidatus Neomarinimicrobiota bacterium]
MFTKAIVRTPCRNIINGLTTTNLGPPDYEKVINQHQQYIKALEKCDLEVLVLDADEDYPDSTFVEDTALLTPYCAVIANPGAFSRKGEIIKIERVLRDYFTNIERINEPGSLDAGDILKVENHYYIGLSERTNKEGTDQLVNILMSYGSTCSTLSLEKALHLKSGVAFLGNDNLVATGEFVSKSEFQDFVILRIDADEECAANCVLVNDNVLIPMGFPNTKKSIESAGYQVIEVDVSEFRKLDGGLSCLSLRF